MAISDRTRKILWTRAGNCCAICRQPLVEPAERGNDAVLIGEECHIVASSSGGPRGGKETSDLDSYENLILLCPSDHVRIDNDTSKYTRSHLIKIKTDHEAWVAKKLTNEAPKQVRVLRALDEECATLSLVITGAGLFSVTSQCMAAEYENDELHSANEVDLVGSLLQSIDDWSSILAEIEVSQRLQAELRMTKSLVKLADSGFVVYVGRLNRTIKIGDECHPWPVAVIRVLRVASNPELHSNNLLSNIPVGAVSLKYRDK